MINKSNFLRFISYIKTKTSRKESGKDLMKGKSMKVISIINQKGGVGKTQTSVNVAVGLSLQGKRVLIIDADAQGNCTSYLSEGINELDLKDIIQKNPGKQNPLIWLKDVLGNETFERDISNLLLNDYTRVEECIYKTKYENLDIIPSTDTKLIKTDQLINVDNKLRHNRLKRALRQVKDQYDFVIIDNAPTFNCITLNTLFCADQIIIPLKIGRFELSGFIQVMQEIETLMYDYESDYDVSVVWQMVHRGNRPINNAFIEMFGSTFNQYEFEYNLNVMDSTIGYQEAVASKSTLNTKMIIEGNSKLAEDYKKLVNEILNERN